MEEVIITFNSLYYFLREERKKKALQKLAPNFYDSINSYLNEKKKELQDLQIKEEKEKLIKEKKKFNNIKKVIAEIIEIRTVKISEIAVRNSLTPDLFDEAIITNAQEIALFETIKKEMRKLKRGINI